MAKGLFITFEGSDGSGKSTQIEKLRAYFDQQGWSVVLTREPGGTAIGEKIRSILLDRENDEMDAMTETMLYAASRAQHVAQVIKPALERGNVVICDRFVDSSIAYQGYGRNLGQAVERINEYAVMDCIPDLTFLMEVDPDVSRERIQKKALDRMELEERQFHRAVFCGYEKLKEENRDRIIGIDAARDIEEISKDIIEYVDTLLERKGKQMRDAGSDG